MIPGRLATFSVDLSCLSALLKTDRDMANSISLELARGRSKIPDYAPFIVPWIADPPWPLSTNERSAAIAKWMGTTRLVEREAPPLAAPTHAWVLYQMRFLITDELIGDLTTFGGFADGIDHLSIALNIDTTETIAVPLDYDLLLKKNMWEKDRARAETALGWLMRLLSLFGDCHISAEGYF